jgi:hypothetical protein
MKMPQMPRTLMGKSFLGAAGLTATVFAASHAGNFLLEQSSPTPEEFAKSQGFSYTPETQKTLARYNNVRVLEKNSFSESLYKIINRPSGDARDGVAYHVSPSFFARLLGSNPVIVMPNFKDGSFADQIQSEHNKPAARSADADRIHFTFVLFHEGGHDEIRQELGDHARRLPQQLVEILCDRAAMKTLSREYGEAGKNHVLAFRGTNPFDDVHDTTLALLREEAKDAKTELEILSAEDESRLPFLGVVRKCKERASSTPEKDGQDNLDRIYSCIKDRFSGSATAAPSANPNLRNRALTFMAGYEFLFRGQNTTPFPSSP